MKHVTIKDIARELNVSVSTVSRALVDDKNIRRETKERVLQVAKEMGYRPNPVAKNLKYGHTNTVGVIVPEMFTPFASRVINGIQDVLYPEGIKVIIAESGESADKERENLQMMQRFMVDGIIVSLCSYKQNNDVYEHLRQAEVPVVFYDRIPHGFDASQVIVDDYMKSFFLVEHLIVSGRKRILLLKGPDEVYNSHERARGYTDALQKYNMACVDELMIDGGLSIADGQRVADQVLEANLKFDAVFAFTDTLAIGLMNRLREKGIKIPEQVAIASFSGTELSQIVYPQLTTVEPPLHEMGRKAAQLILDKLKNPHSPNQSVVLDAEICKRASTEVAGES